VVVADLSEITVEKMNQLIQSKLSAQSYSGKI
jgi:hypothetical protein